MKLEELKTKTTDELSKLLLEKRKEQLNLRFQLANGQLEKVHTMKEARRTVARIKTLINQKKAEEQAKKAA